MIGPAGPLASGAAEREARRRSSAVLVAVAALVVLAFLGFMLAATSGHFVPQVVDLYLVCQYAKAMAEGHAFHYNAGDPASTGATSLLHTAILALAHALGFRGEGLVGFAIAGGAAAYVASVLVARRAGERLGGPREGMLAGALVALGGPVTWSFLYGSDIALFLLLALLVFDGLIESWDTPSPVRWVVPAALLALARPEGLPLGALLAVVWLRGCGRRASAGGRALTALPAALGLAVVVLYRAVTGGWLGTSLADKSLFASYGVPEGLALLTEYVVDLVRGLLLGFFPSQTPIGLSRGWAPYFFPPLALVFVGLAVLRAPAALARPVLGWLAATALVVVAVIPNVFLGVHFQRYVVWAFPPLLVLTAVGLGELASWVAGDRPEVERRVFAAGGILFVVLGALSTLRFAVLYGDMAGDIYRRDVAAAQWIVRNLPPGVAMANLATSVEYLTGHRSINLHGVTAPAFFGNRAAEREAGVYETLARLPEAERPPYLLTSASAQDAYPSMREMVTGAPLFRSAAFGDEIEIFRTRYDVLARGREPADPQALAAVRGLAEVDRLNVCDAKDERDHDYAFVSKAGLAPLYGTVHGDTYAATGGAAGEAVLDGGRAILGGETFSVATRPGRDLLIVLRTAPAVDVNLLRASGPARVTVQFAEAGLIVSADGQVSGRSSVPLHPGWNDVVLRVTGNLVRQPRTRLGISGRYGSFRYWFFQ